MSNVNNSGAIATPPRADRDKLQAMMGRYGETLTQGLNCALTLIGSELGLFADLASHGATNSSTLAQRLGLHERWLREWLRHQACMGQLEYDESTDAFALSPEGRLVFADPHSPFGAHGGLEVVVAMIGRASSLKESFRTGVGHPYDELGHACACGLERMRTYHKKHQLVPDVLPLMPDILARLEHVARIADVGCGAGQATLALARAFPNCHVYGYDTSQHALTRARENLAGAPLPNVTFHDPQSEPMGLHGPFDLITTFAVLHDVADVVHDVAHPDRLIAAIHTALRDDGAWLCEDIRSFPTFAENLRGLPGVGLLYGLSINLCLASGLSEPDGMGLGTLGFNEAVAREMTPAAGFARFRTLPYDSRGNSDFYEIRK